MPSRRRPKAPKGAPAPAQALSDAQRFAQSLRDSEEADRRAKQAAIDRKAEAERLKAEAAEQAGRLQRAQAAHQRAVDLVKEAKRTGKGAAAADLAWREAKAELLELETGKRPAWAPKPVETEPEAEANDVSDDVEATNSEPETVDSD
jgi:hypothetical protein